MSRERTASLVQTADGTFEVVTSSGSTGQFGDPAGGAFSPMDAILAALGACTALDVSSITAKMRQQIGRYAVRVVARQRSEHPRIYVRIDVTHELEGTDLSVEAVRRAIELSARRYCPVSAMLSAGPTEVHHLYVVRGLDPRPWEETGEVLVTGPFATEDAQEAVRGELLEADGPRAADALAGPAGPEAGED